jgi:hypothetical protein
VTTTQLVAIAERILTSTYGGPVRLSQGEVYETRKSIVVRCALAEAPAGDTPATVIVKSVKEERIAPAPWPHARSPR